MDVYYFSHLSHIVIWHIEICHHTRIGLDVKLMLKNKVGKNPTNSQASVYARPLTTFDISPCQNEEVLTIPMASLHLIKGTVGKAVVRISACIKCLNLKKKLLSNEVMSNVNMLSSCPDLSKR